jgi:hypothetical protein
MMAEAAQRYGIVVRDQTGAGNGIAFFVEDTRVNGAANDPLWTANWTPRPDGYLQGKWPYQLMSQFPWDHLQLLKMDLCGDMSGDTCDWPR